MRTELLLALALGTSALRAQRPVVEVSPTGPVRTVAEALRRVAPGGRVVIGAGTYREPTIVVDRPVTLEGRGWPTLDGEERREIMRVTASRVTIRGVRFARVGTMMTEDRAALRLTGAHDCTIEGNRFDDAFFGIYLAATQGCRIAGNVLVARKGTESESGNGIHLWSSRDVVITDNVIRGHRDGIYFEFVRASRVERNTSERNLRYGLHFMYSDSCDYVGNTFRANGSGVAVMYTRQVAMTGNRFVDNPGGAAYGLLLKEIAHPVLVGNEFANNTVGLLADGTTALEARDNVFRHNGWGVRLMANVVDARFARNDFLGNTFDVSTNSRDQTDGAFAGNYYDAYQGYDLDRDGAGDVPFRPVRLFSLLVAQYEPALVLQRSFFVGLLDAAERVIPALTPETLVDAHPAMRPVARTSPALAARR